MKRKISLALALVVAIGLICGCGSAAAAEETRDNEAKKPLAELFPDRFSGQWTGEDGCLNVRADAIIEVPETDGMPTATVKRRVFTQEEADRIIEVFLDGSVLYEEQGMTKSEVRERLERYRAMERGEIPLQLDGERTMEDLPEVIARWEKYLEEAPGDDELIPAQTMFQSDDFYDGVIRGYGYVNGDKVSVDIYNTSRWSTEAIVQVEGYEIFNGISSLPVEIPAITFNNGMNEKAALDIGDRLMTELRMDDFVCDDIEEVAFSSWESGEQFSTGYKIQYARHINGQPLNYTPVNALSVEEGASVHSVWDYESVTLCVCDGRVVYFRWAEPYEAPMLDDSTAVLMDFSDIADIFGKMILVTNDDISEINRINGFDIAHSFDVDKVELNLMRIRDKDNFEEGRIVPVWDFWATTGVEVLDKDYSDLVYDGRYYEIVLTLNAIDGMVIDRNLGY